MRTYQELFRTPEFTPYFLTSALQVAASTVAGPALGTLIYASTGSPLLSALAMFGPSLAQVVGATTLLSAADRLPPRAALTGLALLFGLGDAAQAVPGLPVGAAFAVLLALGMVGSLGGGVRYGLLNEILSREGYLLGRSVLNMSVGVLQVCGYALGGVLVSTVSPRGTLLVGAALGLAAAAVARFGLGRRAPRATGRPSVAQTWRTNARLWSSAPRRCVFLALWVPNGLIVGCESLFVPYSPRHAGMLFAFAALGMLVGDTVTGRFLPARWKERLGSPLRLLLAVPYLVFALNPALPLAVAAVVLASVGYSASLLLQERLMALTPDELSGQALGLHSSGMLTMQGAGAALAGAVAQQTSPATAMTCVAVLSAAVTLALAPGLRTRHAGLPQRRWWRPAAD
ncbi:putative MFS family arabinose efflux permease [Kitasatospora sp. MAA4]|uniref:MFS transporter n=1 Tax=Kitasatospora sp. MAA4 TaxID=3035093 RepID=UPI002476EBFF|nr:MFS transporter [Kitasatospora sp. MAA4]MDH6137609.1 putative MFS family arabinose efflux permease [Kitasatospora sp. MAA4]